MLLRSIGAALLTVGAAHGFKDSSPFVMLSSQPTQGGLESAVVSTAEQVIDGVLAAVGDCEQSKYYIMKQAGSSIADVQDDVASLLRGKKGNGEYAQQIKIDNVLSEIDAQELASKIEKKCAATRGDDEELVHVKDYIFLPVASDLAEPELRDRFSMRSDLANFGRLVTEDHMVIILSAPAITLSHPENLYEMDEPYPTAMHQDLRRDIEYETTKSGNKTMQNGLPLFEKYQFLTPGIFMGLTVALLLIVILWVGVSAIAGLEVSYMAFSKEMGPAAQNKGKQQ